MSSVPATSDVAPPPLQAAEQPRVLVVDDDEANRESLSRRLQRRGYIVEMAVDGPTALAAVEAGSFDLILLDVMMPGMSGMEVLQRLRLTHPPTELPVVMATAKDQSEDVVEALRLGANDYVTKPLDFPVVLARVQTHVSLRQSVRQVLALEQDLLRRNAALESANAELSRAAERTRFELQLAARVQATFLPRDALPQVSGARFAWRYEPTATLAGDALNVCPLDADGRYVGFYVLDVSGHGVAASLTAVVAARLLAPDSMLTDATTRPRLPVRPADVARRLSHRFAFNDDTSQFLTCFYAVLDTVERRLTYVSAGHPDPILVGADRVARRLIGTGMPIGVGEKYDEQTVDLQPGDRVYLYSDGVIESAPPGGDQFGVERLAPFLADEGANLGLDESLSLLLERLSGWRAGRLAIDDVSLLALECL